MLWNRPQLLFFFFFLGILGTLLFSFIDHLQNFPPHNFKCGLFESSALVYLPKSTAIKTRSAFFFLSKTKKEKDEEYFFSFEEKDEEHWFQLEANTILSYFNTAMNREQKFSQHSWLENYYICIQHCLCILGPIKGCDLTLMLIRLKVKATTCPWCHSRRHGLPFRLSFSLPLDAYSTYTAKDNDISYMSYASRGISIENYNFCLT